MSKFEGVADTLYIPLTARIYVSEHFPEYFRDDKAVSLKSEMPYEEIAFQRILPNGRSLPFLQHGPDDKSIY